MGEEIPILGDDIEEVGRGGLHVGVPAAIKLRKVLFHAPALKVPPGALAQVAGRCGGVAATEGCGQGLEGRRECGQQDEAEHHTTGHARQGAIPQGLLQPQAGRELFRTGCRQQALDDLAHDACRQHPHPQDDHGAKHVGHEARLLLHSQNALTQILWQRIDGRYWKTTDGWQRSVVHNGITPELFNPAFNTVSR